MKNNLLASVAIICLFNLSAKAEGLTTVKISSVPPPLPIWNGFYAGLNAGYGWGADSGSHPTNYNAGNWSIAEGFAGNIREAAPLYSSEFNNYLQPIRPSGFFGGGQLGLNIQQYKNFVFGLEADFQGTTSQNTKYNYSSYSMSSNSGSYNANQVGVNGSNIAAGLNYLGTARARAGFLVTPALLVYATGGLAYGKTWANSVAYGASNTTVSFSPSSFSYPSVLQNFWGEGHSSALLVGYSAGGGLEWRFLHSWSLKTEGIYYNLGNMYLSTISFAPPTNGQAVFDRFVISNPSIISSSASINYQGTLGRVGINYHFNTE